MKNVSDAFAKGLAVFSGKSNFQKMLRGKFAMVSSTIDDDGVYYIDQWFPGHMGGGQEILEFEGNRYTRVYAGGTVDDSTLTPLGISKDDVMAFLKKSLLAVRGNTRFDNPCERTEGTWKYSYMPTEEDKTTGMITGKEIITYKKNPVFVHFFIISIVKE